MKAFTYGQNLNQKSFRCQLHPLGLHAHRRRNHQNQMDRQEVASRRFPYLEGRIV